MHRQGGLALGQSLRQSPRVLTWRNHESIAAAHTAFMLLDRFERKLVSKVATVLLAFCSGAAAAPLPPSTLDAIDAFVEQERVQSRIPGIAVAIVHEGRVVHVGGFGSRGQGQPVTGATPFPIGSLSKSFTALLIRQRVETGEVDVDAPVQRYLPWLALADAAAAQTITLRHLLNQTSGLSREAGMRPLLYGGSYTREQLIQDIGQLTPTAAPGQRFQYSNLNFFLLGEVLQSLRQQPWPQQLQQRLFEPLGLGHSHGDWAAAQRDGMTQVHRYWFGHPMAQASAFPDTLAATGGAAASAEDMARYLLMLLDEGRGPKGPVLSAASVQALLQAHSPPTQSTLLGTTFQARYGEAWFVGPFGAAQDARWHLGNLASFAAWMVLLPDTRQAVVVLINANHELPLFGANEIFSRLPIGVVNLLRGQAAPRGANMRDAALKINAVLTAGVVLCIEFAAWLVRQGGRRAALATGLCVVAAGLGMATTGVGWRGLAQFAPDLTLWLAGMLLLLALAAAWRLAKGKNTGRGLRA
jgi:CubicO group peptidase (beta-lactamase class C family)